MSLTDLVYLDYQATTPMAPEATDAMLPYINAYFWNPHSAHRGGRAMTATVENARENVAALLPPGGRVIFTSGATEAINLAIKGVRRPVAAAATEHAAVLDCIEYLDGQTIPVDAAGRLASLPDSNAGLYVAMLVNNEIGTIHPISKLAAEAHARGALFLCDAVQGFGRMPIPDGPDLIAISAHKIHGPKGIGALWVRDGVELEPLIHGGGQEQGLRSGTLSPALCAGFGAAAKVAKERMGQDAAHVGMLWDHALAAFSNWTINGPTEQRYRGNLNIRREGLDVARLMSECREVAFSAGSACASGSGRPSHVLRAIGLDDKQAKFSIRLGWGRYTTPQEIEYAAELVNEAAERQLG